MSGQEKPAARAEGPAHALRASNAPPVRGKEHKGPESRVVGGLLSTPSGNKEFMAAMAAHARKA